jgi:hypothetical protein
MSQPPEQQDSQPRIVISSEDLTTPAVEERVQAMGDAQKVALVREVGAPTTSATSWASILLLVGGGAVGGLVAFIVLRVLLSGLNLFADNAFGSDMTFSVVLALFIGLGISLADAVANRSWAKFGKVAAIALPSAFGAALVAGFIAHLVYSGGLNWLFNNAQETQANTGMSDQELLDYILLRLHPIRGLAWMVVGAGAGVAAGAAARSWKRLGLAVLGGAIGGFLGGFIFDFIPQGDSDAAAGRAEFIAQLVGIVLLGTLVGFATGVIEQARKSRWIEIVSGGLAGKQFILYKSSITLGSSPSADITLIKDSGISPVAAVMEARGSQIVIQTADPSRAVVVNGASVMSSALTDSDVVTLGSTQIRFRERASQQRVPSQLKV